MKTRGRHIGDGHGHWRPNKLAAGMSRTLHRARGRGDDTAHKLSVHGTCDTLAGLLNWNAKRSPRVCSCCGQRVAAVVISDHGRAKLARLRKAANP